jgi:hypothetical protein
MTCLLNTHKASLDAIILRSLHTMVLDLVLCFLCNSLNTLIAEKEIEQISKRRLIE